MHCGWSDPEISWVTTAYPSLRLATLFSGVEPHGGGLRRPRARASLHGGAGGGAPTAMGVGAGRGAPPAMGVGAGRGVPPAMGVGGSAQAGLHGAAKAVRPKPAGRHGSTCSLLPFPAVFLGSYEDVSCSLELLQERAVMC